MTTPNGKLPDFLLIPDPSGQWHLRDSHGTLLFEGLGLCLDTLLSVAAGTGASYKVTIPLPTTPVGESAQWVLPGAGAEDKQK